MMEVREEGEVGGVGGEGIDEAVERERKLTRDERREKRKLDTKLIIDPRYSPRGDFSVGVVQPGDKRLQMERVPARLREAESDERQVLCLELLVQPTPVRLSSATT
jgi:hypothetical protein